MQTEELNEKKGTGLWFFFKDRVMGFVLCRIALHPIVFAWLMYTFSEIIEFG